MKSHSAISVLHFVLHSRDRGDVEYALNVHGGQAINIRRMVPSINVSDAGVVNQCHVQHIYVELSPPADLVRDKKRIPPAFASPTVGMTIQEYSPVD